jgi:hypothetical protein
VRRTDGRALFAWHQTIDNVVSRVFEEASSDPSLAYLAYEDFIKVLILIAETATSGSHATMAHTCIAVSPTQVVQPTDFESRLILPF